MLDRALNKPMQPMSISFTYKSMTKGEILHPLTLSLPTPLMLGEKNTLEYSRSIIL